MGRGVLDAGKSHVEAKTSQHSILAPRSLAAALPAAGGCRVSVAGPLTGPVRPEQRALSIALDVAEHARQHDEFEAEDQLQRERRSRKSIEQAQRDAASREYAQRVWASCVPAAGTEAEEYLAARVRPGRI